jgi:DnaJ-class molecular chaperone
LGVEENATQEEIKTAYRNLAKKHHPDKGGSEEMFKKISEAYEHIGDENRRREYEQTRRDPFGMFGDFFNGNMKRRASPDRVMDINIGVVESYKSGERTQKIPMGMFNMQIYQQTCNNCGGKGFTYRKVCNTCKGETTISEKETFKFTLPHGVDNGQFYRLQGKGDYSNGAYGNLILKINIIPEKNFEKSGNDLVYYAYLTLEDLSKDSIEIPHPAGDISLKMPEDFDTSKPLRVRGKGFTTDHTGDLYVKLNVRFKKAR